MSISPREGSVLGGEEDSGARYSSMTEEGPRFNEDGLGLHSPVFESEFPNIHGASIQQARTEKSRCGGNTLLEAPFFTQSHGFTIHNSQFYACSGHGFTQCLSSAYAEQEDVPSTAFCVIPRHELHTLSVIYTQKGSRFNSAKRKGSDVVIQVFEGSEARKLWQKTLEFSRRLVNAHALDIIGISPTSADSSDPHYIVFDGASSSNTCRVIASMLRKGAMEVTFIGLQAVYGITSGLDYISKTILPLSDLGIDIFNNANHTVHGDEMDQHMKEEFTNSRRPAPQMQSADDPEIPPVTNMPQSAKHPPRREIIWNASGFSELSLSHISQTYDNLIFNNKNAFQNVVLIYQQPSPNERCGKCGELLPPIIFGSSADIEGDDKERHSKLPVDYDKQCGVINEKAAKCVVTRSRLYDDLLLDWQRLHDPNSNFPNEEQDCIPGMSSNNYANNHYS
ncbi:hypothetical protein BT96DRAFT_939713 [Gymnopus androsaceus JB14]|uniref:Uncharacterized protein n=1 Tax=Gymnopus androsaceus JB14 TaxID=1447944 RepID=A0A6A4HJP3_9AGAR|nr:hypothetical protein BT96DRAFT_939713 [Gymnopus androsaceus JB14]